MSAYKVSVVNQYLAESDQLNDVQKNQFWASVQEAAAFQGRPIAQLSPELVAKSFNSRHLEMIRCGQGIGLGGIMRASHAKKLLQTKGYVVKTHQIETRHTKPPPQRRPVLTRAVVDKLSYEDSRKWLLRIQRPLHSTKGKRLDELRKYFDGKPEGFQLTL